MQAQTQPSSSDAGPAQASATHDGAHDFDFLIGNWKARVRRLPDRLNGSNAWDEYSGISNHKKILDSNANFEEFEVDSPEKHLHIKGQTLRLYNPGTHEWSIYLLDVALGTLTLPPVRGQFTGNRGEFYNQQDYKGPSDSGSLCMAEYFATLGADGAVVLGRWWEELGSELGLRAVALIVRSAVAESNLSSAALKGELATSL
jgi:hypothetical protein